MYQSFWVTVWHQIQKQQMDALVRLTTYGNVVFGGVAQVNPRHKQFVLIYLPCIHKRHKTSQLGP